MPRGVAIAEPRQHLFAAAERVIAAEGPSQLTSRAVTREAGVATGLLFAHFANFDDFLVGYAVDRSFQIAGAAAGLPGRAGTGTVAANLSETVLATPLITVLAVTRLTASRPALAANIEAVLGNGTAALRPLERAVVEYLVAEQQLERIPAGADTEALALAVVGVLHHVALTDGTDPAADGRIRRTMTALIDGSQAVTS
ncbi:TetR/AcrR family transcriptional regulator [Micromonospora sp. DR5-3]|uniref:TetR/AcrR family transcriptional regulator n=1 Tax=unclassified Micromonospora TaxID=2617518 RepID=UPI0011D937EC|nr:MULTISPECIES: TetR/AcrR family transcriptional regulator [unclassified Micromonospora]MCW3819220.1 TetR/AcrR family transcriptional regulator [Micromonospora sp. DR5-3]TYC20750.1 TetR/AcrR family transcriptional regulator [Micromonospora sp. MP36]